MLDSGFNINDKVELDDVWSGKDGSKESGAGYVVMAVTPKYIECQNKLRSDLLNRTKYYGKNDLHLIKKVS